MSTNPPNPNERRSRASPPSALAKLPPGASADTRRTAIADVVKTTGVPPRQAAMSLGISSSAYYRLAEDPAFIDAMDEATATFARRMSAVIARAAGSLGSWKAAAFWLERRLPDLYGSKIDLRLEARPIEEELEEKMSDEQRRERMRELAISILQETDETPASS
jgi:hypothetical protein